MMDISNYNINRATMLNCFVLTQILTFFLESLKNLFFWVLFQPLGYAFVLEAKNLHRNVIVIVVNFIVNVFFLIVIVILEMKNLHGHVMRLYWAPCSTPRKWFQKSSTNNLSPTSYCSRHRRQHSPRQKTSDWILTTGSWTYRQSARVSPFLQRHRSSCHLPGQICSQK